MDFISYSFRIPKQEIHSYFDLLWEELMVLSQAGYLSYNGQQYQITEILNYKGQMVLQVPIVLNSHLLRPGFKCVGIF